MGNLGCNLKKEMPDLLRRAPEAKRIWRMPMGNDGLPWPGRNRLFRLIANGNYEIEMLVLKLLPGLTPGPTCMSQNDAKLRHSTRCARRKLRYSGIFLAPFAEAALAAGPT
jgi:hypothetical protein